MQSRCPVPSTVNYCKHINNRQVALTKSAWVIFSQQRHYGDECHWALLTCSKTEGEWKGLFFFFYSKFPLCRCIMVSAPLIFQYVGRAEACCSEGKLIISLCVLQFTCCFFFFFTRCYRHPCNGS